MSTFIVLVGSTTSLSGRTLCFSVMKDGKSLTRSKFFNGKNNGTLANEDFVEAGMRVRKTLVENENPDCVIEMQNGKYCRFTNGEVVQCTSLYKNEIALFEQGIRSAS